MDTTAITRAIEALRGTWEVESGESFGRADYRPVGCTCVFSPSGETIFRSYNGARRYSFVVRQGNGDLRLECFFGDGQRLTVIRFEINGDTMSWQYSPDSVPGIIGYHNAPLNGNHRWTLKRISAVDEIVLDSDASIVQHTRDGAIIDTEGLTENRRDALRLLRALSSDSDQNGNVWRLLMIGKPVTDAQLSEIINLPNVECLDLEESEVTDAGLDSLRSLSRLKVLSLNRTPVTDAGLRVIESLTSLESVQLQMSQVTDQGIERLRQRRPELAIWFVRESERNRYERHAAHAKRIETDRTGAIDEIHFELKSRKAADLQGALAKLPDITSLALGSSDITDDGLAELSGCLQLKELYLGSTAVCGPGLRHLVDLPRLRSLRISRTSVQEHGLEALPKLKALESLGLEETMLSDAGATHVSRCGALKWLNVSQTGVSNAALKLLAGLPELESLRAYQTQLDDDGLLAFAEHPKLIFLVVAGTRVTDSGVANFRRLRPDIHLVS